MATDLDLENKTDSFFEAIHQVSQISDDKYDLWMEAALDFASIGMMPTITEFSVIATKFEEEEKLVLDVLQLSFYFHSLIHNESMKLSDIIHNLQQSNYSIQEDIDSLNSKLERWVQPYSKAIEALFRVFQRIGKIYPVAGNFSFDAVSIPLFDRDFNSNSDRIEQYNPAVNEHLLVALLGIDISSHGENSHVKVALSEQELDWMMLKLEACKKKLKVLKKNLLHIQEGDKDEV